MAPALSTRTSGVRQHVCIPTPGRRSSGGNSRRSTVARGVPPVWRTAYSRGPTASFPQLHPRSATAPADVGPHDSDDAGRHGEKKKVEVARILSVVVEISVTAQDLLSAVNERY